MGMGMLCGHGCDLIAKERSTAAGKLSEEEQKQRQLALQLEAEREKRVEHLQQVAARRIGQMGLARGWRGWPAEWEAAAWRQRMLKQAAARLARPALAASLGHWRHDWVAESRAAAARRE